VEEGPQFLWWTKIHPPVFPFSLPPPLLLLLHIFSLFLLLVKTTIITLEPCALNANFQHFIPRFFLFLNFYNYFMDTPERRVWGWKEAQRQDDFTNNFSIYSFTLPKTFTKGRVSVFDKYLHWPCVSVKKIYIYISIATG